MKNILLIDDDDGFNYLHRRLILKLGIFENVEVANSASEGLEILNKMFAEDHTSPELILLDVKMPEMDGFDFLRHFQRLPEPIVAFTKIAMLSSSLDPTNTINAFRYRQVIDFVEKPLDGYKLSGVLNKIYAAR